MRHIRRGEVNINIYKYWLFSKLQEIHFSTIFCPLQLQVYRPVRDHQSRGIAVFPTTAQAKL